jgi:hypothetical protein
MTEVPKNGIGQDIETYQYMSHNNDEADISQAKREEKKREESIKGSLAWG